MSSAAGDGWGNIPDDFFTSSSSPSPSPISNPAPSLIPAAAAPAVPKRSSYSPASAAASLASGDRDPPPLSRSFSFPKSPASLATTDGSPPPPDQWPPPPGTRHSSSLAEFAVSSAAGTDPIFLPPIRSTLHPGRQPPLEIRPRPPRESQKGSALRAIACSGISGRNPLLWAVGEDGVRCWDLTRLFDGVDAAQRQRWGDEAAAPFLKSRQTCPAFCILADDGLEVVWTGHADGMIMGWSVDTGPLETPGRVITERIAWRAHDGPVLSMAITLFGELWSGSEGGEIKVWPHESLRKCILQMVGNQRPDDLIEKSCVNLRSFLTDDGAFALPTVDINLLLADNNRSKVWSGGYLTLALWDCRTKELLKVMNVNGQVETKFDNLFIQDLRACNTGTSLSPLAKEKSGGALRFFQKSRNALMGAADAFRRAAVKVAFGDDPRKIESITISKDGKIWTGCANGALSMWDDNGCRLREFQDNASAIQCLCSFGTRLWVGYQDGSILLFDLDGKLLGRWFAHSGPILHITVGGPYIITLAYHGGIRGWNLSSPGKSDDILRSELIQKEETYKKFQDMKVLVGSWNVGEERASDKSLKSWLKIHEPAVGLVVIGLQEVEMGAGFLAIATAKETIGFERSPIADWWLDAIDKILTVDSFKRISSRQLAGLLIAVWVRENQKLYVSDIDTSGVPCGFGRAIGNKGAVSIRMRIYGRSMCFVNCHFAAHAEAVDKRNEDFHHIFQTMAFSSQVGGLATAGSFSALQLLRGGNAISFRKPQLSESDMVVFFGDLNYRLSDISYEDAMKLISQRRFEQLRQKDQLRAEMRSRRVFQGLREGQLTFPPTYKFEKNRSSSSSDLGYDSGEKRRVPAWCDRILYRDSRSDSKVSCSLDCPVVSSISLYDCCMDAIESDHKPVKCVFNVDIAYVDQLKKRHVFGDIINNNEELKSLLDQTCMVPEVVVSSDNIVLKDQCSFLLKIANRNADTAACFEIVSRAGFPTWLQVSPATGVICPGQVVEVEMQHVGTRYRESYTEGLPKLHLRDVRETSALLALNITGMYSTAANVYQLQVRCS